MTEKSLGPAEKGKEIEIPLGTEIVVNLPENPTTGYRWHVEAGDHLLLRGDEYQPAGNLPGAGGTRHFRFRSVKTGMSEIHAFLRRSWETGKPPQDSWNVRIRIVER
ncbi:MAG TPA: protease inhibitor I42 family protein [Bryobacteraceae bacterium]|jgi:inhibitor of cysteine peptidase|nr:protease inhibitor I42 family protein [Bryobacteraceae bacterium]